MEAFAVRDLSFAYPEQWQDTLSHLSFSVPRGQFVTLCGPSGCGKSTLLRQFKSVLAPAGALRGEIFFEGRPLGALDQREQSERIGFVQQSPENQIVTDKV
ncbi:MAG: ATP-binding cassette domain-containing protein, partial [Lachnospiraceae bacterium]|nr:ATP-binding cassette domain-containing protein [Lachnospiraceae bacterium]